MGVVFAIVGFYQYETRDIFQNPKVITANAYAPFFRVNSVFWDPSIYGRFLVVAIVVALVVALYGMRPDWIYASDLYGTPLAALFVKQGRARVVYHEHDAPSAGRNLGG